MLYFNDDGTYKTHSAGEAWSVTSNDGDFRFEVRAGDEWAKDGSERSEITFGKTLELNQTYMMSYSFMVEPGAANTADWVNIGQLHGTPDAADSKVLAPIFAVQMDGEKLQIVMRTDANATTTARVADNILYTSTDDIVRGGWYDVQVEIKVDPSGNGVLNVWINGEQVVSYTGAVGYNDAIGPYWKQGVYRSEADETLAVHFKDFEVNTVDSLELKSTASNSLFTSTTTAADDLVAKELTIKDLTFDAYTIKGANKAETIIGTAKADAIAGLSGADSIVGGAGNDSIDGGTGADTLVGGAGDDLLLGGASVDVLYGGEGADTLVGGESSDVLYGGAGSDVFVLNLAKADQVMDFEAGIDRIALTNADSTTMIDLSSAVFTYGMMATEKGVGALHYDQPNGKLYWDATGGSTEDAVLIGVFQNHATLSIDSFL